MGATPSGVRIPPLPLILTKVELNVILNFMVFYAGGFIYNSNSKEILLHLRDDQTKNNPNVWAFFGGLSEPNEKPESTFKREVLEELDIPVNNVEYLRDYFNPDFDTQRYVYFVRVKEKPNFKLSEGSKASWFTIDDALKLKLSKRTREDLLYFKEHLLKG